MVALEIARSKKKAGASAVKQEDPATVGDGPAKKDKKKKPRNGQDTPAAVGKNPSTDDGSVKKKKTVNREGGEQLREEVKEPSGSGDGNKGVERKNNKGGPSGKNYKVSRAPDANTVDPNTEVKEGGVENQQGSKRKKKKKKKSEEVQSATSEEVIIIEDDDEGREAGPDPGVKKKSRKQTTGRGDEEEDGTRGERRRKKKKASEEISGALQLSSEEEAGEAGKRRGRGTQTENRQKVKMEEGRGGGAEEGMGKKKRKREGVDLAKEEVEATEVQEVPRSCKKKKNLQKKREESSSSPADTAGMEETVEEKRKKKKMGKSSTHLEEEGDKVILIENGEPAKKKKAVPKPKEGKSEGADVNETKEKKKRKKREVETEKEETPDKVASEEGCPPLKTPKKKKKKGETPVKKMKIEREDSQDIETPGLVEVVFLSEKRGNTDEVTVNQARRLALQREVDQESHPNAPAAATAALGQWNSAQFDSTDKREKFLRLMGGFKKGSQPVAASGGRANMALGKEGQQSLQQGLLGEFERAQSRRMDFGGKGGGAWVLCAVQ
ncbi:lysine-rich nucleolar protein 1 [Osmerus mordax]|uniref:lysine-rich nucleolar protein 1 n=1 Tax=Osmerus mordax TaxID=8014 RepID=UPI00350EC1F4